MSVVKVLVQRQGFMKGPVKLSVNLAQALCRQSFG
ncbi:hypothetical protein KCQ_05096 [Pectobacterium atrosepticum ICMP 1526]|nr:hypothetical protein KCQ_05096 [Pectobacterium atrosepticum ICMP 1526]